MQRKKRYYILVVFKDSIDEWLPQLESRIIIQETIQINTNPKLIGWKSAIIEICGVDPYKNLEKYELEVLDNHLTDIVAEGYSLLTVYRMINKYLEKHKNYRQYLRYITNYETEKLLSKYLK